MRVSWQQHPVRWSKLKARIETLWPADLGLAIHCNVFKTITKHDTWTEPRHWLVLRGQVIWDFPGPFMTAQPARGQPIAYYDTVYRVHRPGGQPRRLAPCSSIIALLLRDYLDRPVSRLFAPFTDDHWEFTDLLRAADRRLGRRRLAAWRISLDTAHPAQPILRCRLDRPG
jgi:hypothetical protein